MGFFKLKASGKKADINLGKVKRERLVARAKRLKDALKKDPKHPKRHARTVELKGILEELGAREESLKEILGE